jgi:hypothetical protein
LVAPCPDLFQELWRMREIAIEGEYIFASCCEKTLSQRAGVPETSL